MSTFQAFVAVPFLPLAGGGKAFFLLAEDGEDGWAFFLLAGGGEAGSHWLTWRDAPRLQNCIVTCRVEINTNFVNAKEYFRYYYRLRFLRPLFSSLGEGKAIEIRSKPTRSSDRERARQRTY